MLKLTPITFDKFIRELNAFSKDTVEIDLTQVQFISPAVLTQLSALCYALHSEKKLITVKLNKKIGLYLIRAGFIPSIRSVAKIEPAEFELGRYYELLHGSSPLLIEVTKIESLSSLPVLLDQIVKVLMTRLEFPKNEAFDTVTAISEVCQNTLDHNHDTCGFIAMQVYSAGKKSFLQIGVSDYGAGLAATLNRNEQNGKLLANIEAINYATQAGTSEYVDRTRGTGLYHLLKIMQKNSGVVQIHSGDGKVRYRSDKKTEFDKVPYLPGVHIVLELNAKAA